MFSSSHTSQFIIPVLHWLFPHASAEALDRLHFFIRKTAHFTEYFVFSFLLLRSVRGEQRGWQLRWAIAALAIAAGYSALDEFHQSFVPSRTASPWDSLLDTSGAAVAQIVLWLWFRVRRLIGTPDNITSIAQD
jgi:VanZ family protein